MLDKRANFRTPGHREALVAGRSRAERGVRAGLVIKWLRAARRARIGDHVALDRGYFHAALRSLVAGGARAASGWLAVAAPLGCPPCLRWGGQLRT